MTAQQKKKKKKLWVNLSFDTSIIIINININIYFDVSAFTEVMFWMQDFYLYSYFYTVVSLFYWSKRSEYFLHN